MPRTKEQFEAMRQATREKIQTAAMRLFVSKGFDSVNVQDIADLAGISIGLLYRHYRTKEDLFQELASFAQAGVGKLIELFESGASPKELIDRFVDEIYYDMTSGEELANLLILMKQDVSRDTAEPDRRGGESKSNSAKMFRKGQELQNAMTKLIRKGQQSGEFGSGDPHAMALFFFSAIHGLAEMKMLLKEDFVMPSPSIVTAFLYRKGE
ncbi:TetR/AcrR family transcriptional regulator [Paenibacillaceae bacterium WGS1546]|uniref:TetR/AcrR family transcriptional regulator n=1 Tax=Cohnella sp. WGS1546 TaxID=3366810 RepID=UPI00372D5BF9